MRPRCCGRRRAQPRPPAQLARGWLYVFMTSARYSASFTPHSLAACTLSGESTLGSASSDWMDCRMVFTLYAAAGRKRGAQGQVGRKE